VICRIGFVRLLWRFWEGKAVVFVGEKKIYKFANFICDFKFSDTRVAIFYRFHCHRCSVVLPPKYLHINHTNKLQCWWTSCLRPVNVWTYAGIMQMWPVSAVLGCFFIFCNFIYCALFGSTTFQIIYIYIQLHYTLHERQYSKWHNRGTLKKKTDYHACKKKIPSGQWQGM